LAEEEGLERENSLQKVHSGDACRAVLVRFLALLRTDPSGPLELSGPTRAARRIV